MFKKTLVASALLAVGFNASAALTVENATAADKTKGQTVSVEGTATGSAVALANVSITSSAAAKATYTSFSGVSLELSGGTFNPASNLTLNVIENAGGNDLSLVGADYTVTFKSASRAEIALTAAGLAKLTAAITTSTNEFVVGGLNVNAADITSGGKVSVAVEADSNIPGIDLETGSGAVATGVTQFSAAVKDDAGASGKAADKIDVGQARMYWADAAKDASDSIIATVENAATEVNSATTAGTQKITWTLKGDLSFLDADADGKVDTGTSITVDDDNAGATATGVTVAADFQTVTFTSAAPTFGAAADDHEVEFVITTDGKRVIPQSTFTVSAAMPYTNAASLVQSFAATDMAAGGWTLNGDGAFISFLPFGSAFSQSVTITNTGSVEGEITVDWITGGTTTTTALTSTAKPKAVTDISAELRSIAAANGITGNAALDIVVNSPNGQISIDALYYSKADQDRGVMATDK